MRRKLILLHQEDFEMKVVILRSELIVALKDLMFVIKHFEMFLRKYRLLPAKICKKKMKILQTMQFLRQR